MSRQGPVGWRRTRLRLSPWSVGLMGLERPESAQQLDEPGLEKSVRGSSYGLNG